MSRYRRSYKDSHDESFISGLAGLIMLIILSFIPKVINFIKENFILFIIILILIIGLIAFIIYKKTKNKKIKQYPGSYISSYELNDNISNNTNYYNKEENSTYKGQINEYEIYEKLNEMNFYKRVLKNVYIPKKDGGTTEIDVIMISNKGIFVIESKNYGGWIFGNSQSKKWYQTFNRNYKKSFLNPIWQNKLHVSCLSQMLNIPINLFESIIVFGGNTTIKNVEKMEDDIKITNISNIEEVIYKIYNVRQQTYSNEEVDLIYEKLKNYKYVDDTVKLDHIVNINKKM